jgi:hypothetical protein
MAHKTVEEAVESRLRTLWTDCPIYTENLETQPPSDSGAYLLLQFPMAETMRWPINQRRYREEGGFRIVIHLPAGTGMDTMRTWGEALRTMFLDVSFSGVNCRVPTDPFTDDRSGEGRYFVGSIVCPYDFNFSA